MVSISMAALSLIFNLWDNAANSLKLKICETKNSAACAAGFA